MKIPRNRDSLVSLAHRAEAGVTALGTALGVAQNTAPRITIDIHDLVGEPGSLTNTGKQGAYNRMHAALTNARGARALALADGHKLCTSAIDALKKHLGRSWTPLWTAAGFGGFTLTVRQNRTGPKLIELRNYFRDTPAREIASEGITAAACEAAVAAIQAAEHGRDAAKSDFRDARDARNVSARKLKDRLSGLQEELGHLLSDSDNRWADFGFPRPIDGSIPDRVQGVTATPGLPGMVFVQWPASPRAINYRVSWSLPASGAEVTEAGLFSDRATHLTGLPSGAIIIIHVTARNNAGETGATKVDVTVP